MERGQDSTAIKGTPIETLYLTVGSKSKEESLSV